MTIELDLKSFVFGATGFVGREVVRQLCVRGTRTIAHVRPDSKQLENWRARFSEMGATIDVTPWEVDALAARMRELRPTQIYILIGTTRGKAKADGVDGNIYERVDLGLTTMVVDAVKQAALVPAPRIVYLSSVGADAGARSAYLRARGRAEEAVKGSGAPWVIARPSIITGDRDDSRIGERTAAVVGDGLLAVARGLFGPWGGKKLRDRYRSTTPDVLASALIRIGEEPEVGIVVDGAGLR
ncbi:MAG TPA: NAD(P)H-binding protein [Kofleriaceae bacterium]|nr:NAD(P)H-binding protein [Kofleriaceae bacterium]